MFRAYHCMDKNLSEGSETNKNPKTETYKDTPQN